MGLTPPGWLLPSWVRGVEKIGATADRDAIEAAGARILEALQSPGRVYHTVRHLVGTLARVDELAEEAHDPEAVRIAAWFHDVVLTERTVGSLTRLKVDTVASAQLAETTLLDLGVPAARARRVKDLVLVLAEHNPPADDLDAAVLSDADLGLLAADPQEYKAYLERMGCELPDLSAREFCEYRLGKVQEMLSRRDIFHSPLGREWERAARHNLEAEEQRIQKKLETVDAAVSSTDA